ncbi:MAG: hypothetical protein K8F91_12580, partial [Candidatus Obscuribacterales bacterium]|nr:hypothetical protein [Candidatus Obscuribacterales bacterium]
LELKDIVSRRQGEDHETIVLVKEIESILSRIEEKADELSAKRSHKKRNNMTSKIVQAKVVSTVVNPVITSISV